MFAALSYGSVRICDKDPRIQLILTFKFVITSTSTGMRMLMVINLIDRNKNIENLLWGAESEMYR